MDGTYLFGGGVSGHLYLLLRIYIRHRYIWYTSSGDLIRVLKAHYTVLFVLNISNSNITSFTHL